VQQHIAGVVEISVVLVKKNWKSVHIFQSYYQTSIAYFLEHGVYTLRYSDRFSVCVSVHLSLMRLSSFITPEGSKISHKNSKIHKITHTKYDTKLHISTHSKTIKNTKRTLYQTGIWDLQVSTALLYSMFNWHVIHSIYYAIRQHKILQ